MHNPTLPPTMPPSIIALVASLDSKIDEKERDRARLVAPLDSEIGALRQERRQIVGAFAPAAAAPFLDAPDAMPLGWRPKHWEHVQRKGKDDNGGDLCPRSRRPYMETEERLYPGNDHATRARRLGIGRLNPTGPGAWLTIPECWQIEMARRVSA